MSKTRFSTGQYTEDDDYIIYYILDNDATDGWPLGEKQEVLEIIQVLQRLAKSWKPDEGEIKHTDPRIHPWLDSDRVAEEYGIPSWLVIEHCEEGRIAEAYKSPDSPKWYFPMNSFTRWRAGK